MMAEAAAKTAGSDVSPASTDDCFHHVKQLKRTDATPPASTARWMMCIEAARLRAASAPYSLRALAGLRSRALLRFRFECGGGSLQLARVVWLFSEALW
jgi:hypothetical protein